MSFFNESIDLSNFQLCFGRAPRLIPLMILTQSTPTLRTPQQIADHVLRTFTSDLADARDHLLELEAKLHQPHFANLHRRLAPTFQPADRVILSTWHRRREYKIKGDVRPRVATFFPRVDGPQPWIRRKASRVQGYTPDSVRQAQVRRQAGWTEDDVLIFLQPNLQVATFEWAEILAQASRVGRCLFDRRRCLCSTHTDGRIAAFREQPSEV
ncbi:uncharacterized protein FIBRA_08365 [Fibroporia radiculosa]|uniref:Uncharacterized protein n=1 Tax=Fibroporia radiculosa TaxID=599839 RepID=J4ICB4_9APHY|nr:uncharacterized protein FIBRA_08365 [Fibroporia radiculosa]CCM06116.1 predicted protein [Fibroporia radiculosa]